MEGGISSYITDAVSCVTAVTGVITGSPVLMTMFAAGLLVVGAKVFKGIKRASK